MKKLRTSRRCGPSRGTTIHRLAKSGSSRAADPVRGRFGRRPSSEAGSRLQGCPRIPPGINAYRDKDLARGDRRLEAPFIESQVSSRLIGLGTAVPPHRSAQTAIADFMIRVAEAQDDCPPQFARYVQHLSRQSAIGFRHTVVPDFTQQNPDDFTFFPPNWTLTPSPTTAERMAVYRDASVDLAEAAAQRALAAAQVPVEAVTHLVLSTCTGFFAPGPDIMLMDRLGLSSSVQRSILGFMGCYAGLNGLRAADHIVRAEPDAVVLQVAVELCSLHFQSQPDLRHLVANLLFADGAAAAVYAQKGVPGAWAPRIVGTASSVSTDTQDQMGWVIGDHGFVMTLADSVPGHLRDEALSFVSGLLAQGALTRADVRGWAVHPGGKKILQALKSALSLDEASLGSSFEVLYDYGNMSSATVLFVLERLFERWAPSDRGPTVALSFGPGLTIEGALLVP